MPPIEIVWFWCCLNPREQAILVLCMNAFAFSPGYIRQDTFYGAWALGGYSPTNKLVVQFVANYDLVPSEIVDIEGNEIPIFLLQTWLWPALYAYSFDPGLVCDQECFILRYSR